MSVIDPNLFVGICPFRPIPSSVAELEALRNAAQLDAAVATGFDSLLYHDPILGLQRDLDAHASLHDWLSFYAVINPEFPGLEEQIRDASLQTRVVGLRLFPTLHHYPLDAPRVQRTFELAGEHGLPVNLTARLLDGRVAPRYLQQGTLSREDLAACVARSGKTTLILSMFFFAELSAIAAELSERENVFLDLGCGKPSTASYDGLPSWFPAERALLGSGAPLYYWKGNRLALAGSRLSASQRAAILGTTAKEVFAWT